MSLRRLVPTFTAFLLTLPAIFAQTPDATPKHDPRIPEIIHSLSQVKSIRETQLSPDGSLIAWIAGGEGIVLAPVSNPTQTRQITVCTADAEGHEGSLAWSPDSKTLAFFSNCTPDHKVAIFTADVTASTTPHQFAELNGYAKNLQYSPDGKLLSFLYVEGATRPSGALAAMKPPSGVIGVEGLEVQRVAAVDTDPESPKTPRFLTPANLHVYEFDWSRDSNRLAYIAAPPPGEDNWWTAKLYTQTRPPAPWQTVNRVCPMNGCDQPNAVFDPNTTTGALHGLQIAVPRWSPDGSKIAFIGGLMSDQGSTGGDIYVIPSTGGDTVNLTANRSETAVWISWTITGEIDYSAIAGGFSQFRTIVLDSPSNLSVRNNVRDFQFPAGIGDGRLEMSLSYEGGQFAFIKSSFSEPPEVWYARDVGAECKPPSDDPNACYEFQQITHLNDALKPSWGKSESIEWDNEGFHINGWLLYPANYDPGKKYPMIVYVHGGPSAATQPHWPGKGFGAAPFSALGYFVLMPNPRGSFGEGEKFTQANRKDFGYGDLRDILTGVDTVIKDHPIDPQRIGITGWSYGGFMTMFAVTQTNRFHAAVSGAGLSDWLSYYGENSIDQWMIPFFGASVYDDPTVYAKSSAINYIKNVKTPTLLVVGDRDGECPAPQSFEFWHALRDEHVPTELVVYPNEGHGFVNPDHRIDVLERALAWFDEYMP